MNSNEYERTLSLTESQQQYKEPEWVRIGAAVHLFGIGRTSLYNLLATGKVRSVCIRKRGSVRGIRLVSADSLRCYISSFASHS